MRPLRVLSLSIALTCPAVAWAAAQAVSTEPAPVTAASPAVALSEVEQRWGIRILGIRLSAAGYMMDFRYHVVDAEKAAPLFIRGLQPVLEDEASGSKFIVPAPPKTGPLRSTNRPQAGRNYFMFFANPGRFVKAGRALTLTIGEFRVEHLRLMAESEPFPETPRFDSKAVQVRHASAPAGGRAAGAEIGTQAGHEGHGGTATPVTTGRARPVKVTVPDLTLTDQDGAQVKVRELLEGDTPVVLTFLFTSCTTVCPVLAATVVQAQRELGAEADRIRFVSISIDPENDSVEKMREYLAERGARPNWRFLAGTLSQSEALQRAFDVYRGNKMAHPPGYFIRDPRSGEWWRIGGLANAQVVAGEYRRLAGPGQ